MTSPAISSKWHNYDVNHNGRNAFMSKFETVASRFALTKSNFVLDPEKDYKCFARSDIDVQGLTERLRVDLVTDLAPKRLFFGPYGAGKSHTLIVAAKELEKLTPIRLVRMECPN